MTATQQKKSCFVIAPIGDDETDVRVRSDKILNHIITPCVTSCGYATPVRSDTLGKTGQITNQIIDRILGDDLVIADLTDHNANVFYELAIRHAKRAPVIHLIEVGQAIPFDVIGMRTVSVDHTDLNSVEKCKSEMITEIRDIESSTEPAATPISTAIDLQGLRQSSAPDDRTLASVLETLQGLRNQIGAMDSRIVSIDHRDGIEQIVINHERHARWGTNPPPWMCPKCGSYTATINAQGLGSCPRCYATFRVRPRAGTATLGRAVTDPLK